MNSEEETTGTMYTHREGCNVWARWVVCSYTRWSYH